MALPTFVAIDFETGDARPESACAVGAVRVVGGRIDVRLKTLLRPRRSNFRFSRLHGIKRRDVADAPNFRSFWPTLEGFFQGARFMAAHNAPFDRSVLQLLCLNAGVVAPRLPFVCTRAIAARAFGATTNELAVVCATLGIPLKHHDPLSDAEAAAMIVLLAYNSGAAILRFKRRAGC